MTGKRPAGHSGPKARKATAAPLLIAVLALLVGGCRGTAGVDDSPVPAPSPVRVGYVSIPTDPYELNAAAIAGDVLTLEVSYAGGCRDHVFELLSSDTFQESAPVELGMVLFHNAGDDPCEAWLTEQLRFDLSPIRELFRTVYGVDSGVVILRLARAPELVYRF